MARRKRRSPPAGKEKARRLPVVNTRVLGGIAVVLIVALVLYVFLAPPEKPPPKPEPVVTEGRSVVNDDGLTDEQYFSKYKWFHDNPKKYADRIPAELKGKVEVYPEQRIINTGRIRMLVNAVGMRPVKKGEDISDMIPTD